MKRRRERSVLVDLVVPIAALVFLGFWTLAAMAAPEAKQAFSGLQLPFIENNGQADPNIQFYAVARDSTFLVTREGEIIVALPPAGPEHAKPTLVRERFEGGRTAGVRGVTPAETRVNFYLGKDPAQWQVGVGTFENVSLGEIYEGIELELRAYKGRVEHVFHVQPGADPSQIRENVYVSITPQADLDGRDRNVDWFYRGLDISIATASADGTARLWEAATGKEIRRFTGHAAGLENITFLPDGKHILTGSDDGTAMLWDVDYHTTMEYLCSRLLRDLTEEDRSQFGITDQSPTCPAQ